MAPLCLGERAPCAPAALQQASTRPLELKALSQREARGRGTRAHTNRLSR